MQQELTMDQITELRGADVYSSDGDRIGSVGDVFVDQQTGRPEWIGLSTGFFGTKRALVPVHGANLNQEGITVSYSKDQVQGAPDVDEDEISQEVERQLYSHYGLGYSEQESDTGLPASGSSGDVPEQLNERARQMTRSEEELRVGKQERQVGGLALHKWVETEQVEVPVEVRREKARVTREPVDGTVAGGEIGEDSLEVTLSEERPVVQKETVAKERIGIEKNVETDTETVREELRKEQVDIDESPRGR